MKIAIPLFGGLISARFDYTQKFLLVTAGNGEIIERQELQAEGLTPQKRFKKLSESGIDTLICGDIDKTSARQLSCNGIRIHSRVTGEAEDAIRCVLKKGLEPVLPGDHIYVKRKSRFYIHHGIYMGEGKVIHFTGSIREKVDPEVRETDLSRFLKGGKLKKRDYRKRLPASETIRIAKEQLSDKNFSIIWNNCEHFATYCATGKKKSRQLKKALFGLSTAVGAGIALYALTRMVLSFEIKS